MMQAPWTEVGHLQQDVSSIQTSMYGKADKYEVSKISSDVDGLEREVRELISSLDGLRVELQALQQSHREALDVIAGILDTLEAK